MLPSLPTLLTALAALAAVLGLILLAARAARMSGLASRTPGPGNGSLAVHDVLALDTSRRLYLLRCRDRHVLLLTGGSQDIVIGWLPDEDAAP